MQGMLNGARKCLTSDKRCQSTNMDLKWFSSLFDELTARFLELYDDLEVKISLIFSLHPQYLALSLSRSLEAECPPRKFL